MYLLASRSGIHTGRTLAKLLNCRFSTNAFRIPRESRVVVRYGNAQESSRVYQDTSINSVWAILRMSNKQKLWKYVIDSNLIVPKYHEYRGYIPDELGYPFLFRERLRRGGRDIVFCERKGDVPNDREGYLVPFIPTSREYRVHVLFDKVVRVFRKMPPLGTEGGGIQIRSSYFGWYYARADLDQVLCAKSLVETCIETAKILGCAFCGLDVAWSRDIKRWIVWEANSAPSLNGNTLLTYANEISKRI